MENLIANFISLPHAVIYAIFGAIGGLVGGLLSQAFKKITKIEKASNIILIIAIVASIQLPRFVLPQLERSVESITAMTRIKQNRLFQVLFRLHPEAETELRARMDEIIKSTPDEEVFAQSQAVSAEIVMRYFKKHLPYASDEVTHKLLMHSANAMKRFQNKPALCVAYYLGRPQFSPEDLDANLIAEESNLKADIMESAVSNPSVPPKASSIDDVMAVIVQAYTQNGYAIENISKIGDVLSLPPQEGCIIVTEFSSALASLDAKQAAYVFKNLMYVAQEE